MKKISFQTLGCRLNQSETASIQNSFEANGYTVVDFGQPSDIVVINTCTVTQGGDADTRRLVHKVNRLNPNARIALVGCQAQVQKEKLAVLPNVRWIVGNQRKMDLVSVFNEHPNPPQAEVITPTIERDAFTLPTAAVDHHHTRANMKIQDGCDFFCSFCEIPYARGRARSRVFEDIVLEARALAAAGHQEIVLTGINIGTFSHEGKTLMDVIRQLDDIEGLERIRISSIEPTTIPSEIFDFMHQPHRLCRYLHIPLQSGCDEVLTGMKRKYTGGEFSRFIQHAYQKVPQICIGTDVIVGFPGETDKYFDQTVDLIRREPIHYVHVFSYSPRHMAQSRLRPDSIPAHVITRRSQILRELSARKRRMFHESLLGTTQKVLFEDYKNGFWSGLTDHYVRVKVQSDQDLSNRILEIRLQVVEGQNMRGEI
ncbi:MAG: tRNA (N(6)-L-threonylcarbamoyladenosine(37)-C(2))-methylthiotransferase MtaB [Candidatus Omnitrophica bacterium]|nr:tRNA (N(6)-L-threonylcarbamoyladenosine(37)-C(2))-methylthiotransferase MtaB [Candidatus Omnitrophota bacterium]